MSSGIFIYLAEQSAAVVNKLYGAKSTTLSSERAQGPFVSKAVFQSVSALAKNYIMRLLFYEKAVSADDLRGWIAGDGHGAEHAQAIEELIRLRIIQESFDAVSEDDRSEGVAGVDTDVVILDLAFSAGRGSGRPGPDTGAGVDKGLFCMNPHFRKSFKQAILAPQEPWGRAFGKTQTPADHPLTPVSPPTKEELRRQSVVKWDALLRFLVGVPGATSIIPGGTIERFVRATGLMAEGVSAASRAASLSRQQRPAGGGKLSLRNLTITEKGYAYMLKSYQEQVWIFVFELIHLAADKEELLSLLFTISYCEFGKGYPISALSPAQRMLVVEFSQLGLVYACGSASDRISEGSIFDQGLVQTIRAEGDSSTLDRIRFYPASIAINMIFRSQHNLSPQALSSSTRIGQDYGDSSADQLSMSLAGGGGNAGEEASGTTNIHRGVAGFNAEANDDRTAEMHNSLSSGLEIIVETNMQVTAYLTSDLHLALLNLFVEFSVLLPNVVIGTLTRDKAKQAFSMGVRVKQIVDFLCVHAHALTRDHKPIVPANVVDQLVLWESERFRVGSADSILLKFDSMPGFDAKSFAAVEAYASRIGVNLCSNAASMSLVVPYDGYEQIRAFIEDLLM